MTTDDTPKSFLLSAYMADLSRQPASEAAQQLVDDLLAATLEAEAQGDRKRERQRSLKAVATLRATIGALVHDILRAQLNEAAQGFCYVTSRDSTRFTATPAASRQYKAVRDTWPQAGFLDYEKGLNHGFTWDDNTEWPEGKQGGKAPRLRARPPLIALAAKHGIRPDNLRDHFRVAHSTSYPVTLDKKPVRHRTPESDAIAEKVKRINEGLEQHTFDPPIRPRFYAGFQADPDRPGQLVWGGRLYARGEAETPATDEDPEEGRSFQLWPEAKRLTLRIDGEPVAEVDIKASHLTIYHALLGIPLPDGKDPYEVPGVPRVLVKHVVTAMFGQRSAELERWPRLRPDPKNDAMREARKGKKVREVVRRVVETIPGLKQLARSGLGWGELQRMEAGILLDVMDTLLRESGIPTLPVHDSLIVPERYVDSVAVALRGRFSRVTGVYPMLTIAKADQPEVIWANKVNHIEMNN